MMWLAWLLLITARVATQGLTTDNAEELTDESFEERLAEYELLLVAYRDADPQNRQLDQEVELAAAELAISDEAIFVGLIDLKDDTTKGAAKKGHIRKGPQIKCFRRGKLLNFGPNSGDARSLVDFMRFLSAPVSRVLPSEAALNKFLHEVHETVVLGIFADSTRPTHNAWMKAAEELRPPFRFAEVGLDTAKASKLFADAPLVEAKNHFAVVPPAKWVAKGEAPYVLSSEFKQIKDFVYAHALTRVAPMTSYAHMQYKSEGRALVSLSFSQKRLGKMFKYIVNRLHKLFAEEPELTARYAFTIVDREKAAPMFADFGVPSDKVHLPPPHAAMLSGGLSGGLKGSLSSGLSSGLLPTES